MTACQSDNIPSIRRNEKPGFQFRVQVLDHRGGQLVANLPFYCSKVPEQWEGNKTFYITGSGASGQTLQVNSTIFDYTEMRVANSNEIVTIRPIDKVLGPNFRFSAPDREGLSTLTVSQGLKIMGTYKGKLTAD
jgi:hypothetical protein